MGIDLNKPRQWQEADESEYLFADSVTIGMTKIRRDNGYIVTAPVITMEIRPPEDAPMAKPIYVIFPMDEAYGLQLMSALSEVLSMIQAGYVPPDNREG